MRGLNGKNVIVTGGAGAIGSAICRRFAEYGAKKVAGELKGFACGADITDYKAVADGIAAFEKARDAQLKRGFRVMFSQGLEGPYGH